MCVCVCVYMYIYMCVGVYEERERESDREREREKAQREKYKPIRNICCLTVFMVILKRGRIQKERLSLKLGAASPEQVAPLFEVAVCRLQVHAAAAASAAVRPRLTQRRLTASSLLLLVRLV